MALQPLPRALGLVGLLACSLLAAAAGAASRSAEEGGEGACARGSPTCPADLGGHGQPTVESRGSALLQVKRPEVAQRAAAPADEEDEDEDVGEELELVEEEREEEREELASEVKVKFLEWNVWYANKDTRAMAEVITPNSPDVIGLNEFTTSKSSLRAHLNERIPQRRYELQPGWSSFRGYGTYIFYDSNRFEGIEGGVETVRCSGTRNGDRAANWAVLREKATRGVLITGGIHLSYCSSGCDSTHACELGRLYDRFEAMKSKHPGASVVWMGDLNRSPNSYVFQNILRGRLGSRQVFPVQDLARTSDRTYYRGGVIDHIFGESSLTRLAGGSTGQGHPKQRLAGADHFPIFATVSWRPSGGSSAPPAGPPSPPAPTGGCRSSAVQRRRRAGSCSCRRRSGVSSTGLYACEGSRIVMKR